MLNARLVWGSQNTHKKGIQNEKRIIKKNTRFGCHSYLISSSSSMSMTFSPHYSTVAFTFSVSSDAERRRDTTTIRCVCLRAYTVYDGVRMGAYVVFDLSATDHKTLIICRIVFASKSNSSTDWGHNRQSKWANIREIPHTDRIYL